MTNSFAVDYHQTNYTACNTEIKQYERLINRYSALRLITIGLGIFSFYHSLKLDGSWVPVLVVFLIIFGFSVLVRKQNVFQKRLDYLRDLAKVHLNELNALERKANIYIDGSRWLDDEHPYTSDLDIFGKGSLFQLLNRCATNLGNAKLAGWLMKRAAAPVIRERQGAVEELAGKPYWKHHFQAVLLFSNQAKENEVENLFQYLGSDSGAASSFLRFYVRWSIWFFLVLAIIAWFFPVFILALLAMGIANWLLTQAYNVRVMKTDSLIGKMTKTLNHFSDALTAISSENWKSTLAVQLAAGLKGDDQDKLPGQIRRLALLINLLNLGMSTIGPILNFIMPLNVRQFLAIEDWKQSNKVNLEAAFDAIANFEALISLSCIKNNYPHWAFPEINQGENYTLTAHFVGHPLIPEQSRVSNDYSLNNELKIDIITGSNMAGKSTFLRTLGINTVLALCGAPVCAEKMEVSPMLIFSYMRIKDSLNESTSTFKAELDRLQRLLKILSTEDKVFFLIDEMLRGTNSVDKYLGSKAVIEKLISQRAVGIIATHDLQIAELEQAYPDYVRNFYFDIQIDGSEMTFDYKLKEGECKTFNASLLLKRLGI